MWLLLSIMVLGFLAGAEVDLFVPSFPQIRGIFGLSVPQVESLLSINLISHCIAALWAGHLGDQYGRRRVIIWGLLIFIIGSMLCSFAPSFYFLVLGRIAQGVGIAAPATLSYLIIADFFPIQKQQKIMSQLNGIITLGMGFAPILGSSLTLYFGWRSNFLFLLIWAIMCLGMAWFFLPRSLSQMNKVSSTSSKDSVISYSELLRSTKVIYAVLSISWMVVPYWVFVGISSVLWVQDLGIPLKYFGWYQGALLLAFSLVSLSCSYWLKLWGEKNCFYGSIIGLVVFLMGVCILAIFDTKNPLLILLIMMIECISMVFPITILYPRILALIPGGSGKISALINSGRLVFTALGMQVVAHFYQHNFASVAWVMIVSMLFALWCLRRFLSNHHLEAIDF
jgi:DHA1 family bicyclomycin/chloramphenicol resistance-like MFS transporter